MLNSNAMQVNLGAQNVTFMTTGVCVSVSVCVCLCLCLCLCLCVHMCVIMCRYCRIMSLHHKFGQPSGA